MKIKRTLELKTKIKNIQLGDVISFKLSDGEKVEARAVKECPSGRMLMLFENCLNETHCMNENGSTEGGWEQSDLRAWLNSEILGRFPEKIRKHMVADYSGDYLRCLDHAEVFGETYDGEDASAAQLPALKDRKNRIASQGNIDDYAAWWLRDVVSASTFAVVGYYGSAGCSGASNAGIGVRPAFYLDIFNPSGSSRLDEDRKIIMGYGKDNAIALYETLEEDENGKPTKIKEVKQCQLKSTALKCGQNISNNQTT